MNIDFSKVKSGTGITYRDGKKGEFLYYEGRSQSDKVVTFSVEDQEIWLHREDGSYHASGSARLDIVAVDGMVDLSKYRVGDRVITRSGSVGIFVGSDKGYEQPYRCCFDLEVRTYWTHGGHSLSSAESAWDIVKVIPREECESQEK